MRTRINSGFYFAYQKSKVRIIELFLYFPNKSVDFIVRLTEHKPRKHKKALTTYYGNQGFNTTRSIMNAKINEGKLISGKDALIALANGKELQQNVDGNWVDIRRDISWRSILGEAYKLRLKPRTILINGIEVPAPFLPEEGELFYHASPEYEKGYAKSAAHERNETTWQQFGAWRTEEEIKQVVIALRFVLTGGSHDN